MSDLRACRYGGWELIRDIDGIARRVGIVHDKADAALLIAASELLAACRAMSVCAGPSEIWNGETEAALKLIEAAIEKAEGRS